MYQGRKYPCIVVSSRTFGCLDNAYGLDGKKKWNGQQACSLSCQNPRILELSTLRSTRTPPPIHEDMKYLTSNLPQIDLVSCIRRCPETRTRIGRCEQKWILPCRSRSLARVIEFPSSSLISTSSRPPLIDCILTRRPILEPAVNPTSILYRKDRNGHHSSP